MGLPLDEALNLQWRSKSPHTSKKEQSSARRLMLKKDSLAHPLDSPYFLCL